MRIPGVPYTHGHPHGTITPTAIVLHRTYGGWPGSRQVGLSAGVNFHFLVGKTEGRWEQFLDTTELAWHCSNNGWSFGIEFEGVNEDTLTPWQVRAGAWIIAVGAKGHGIPLVHYSGPRIGSFHGCLDHASVKGSTHTDRVTEADWLRMMALIDSPANPNPDRKALAAYVLPGVMGMPNLDPGVKDAAWHIVWLQRGLNVAADAQLHESGVYDQETINAVVAFQGNVARLVGHPLTDFPGAAHEQTRYYLVRALQNLAA